MWVCKYTFWKPFCDDAYDPILILVLPQIWPFSGLLLLYMKAHKWLPSESSIKRSLKWIKSCDLDCMIDQPRLIHFSNKYWPNDLITKNPANEQIYKCANKEKRTYRCTSYVGPDFMLVILMKVRLKIFWSCKIIHNYAVYIIPLLTNSLTITHMKVRAQS